MKKLALAVLLMPAIAFGQALPTPTFNSLTLQNPLTPGNGGTGVANSGTITLGGNLTTSGANPLTLTTTGSTNITLPTSGTLLNNSSGATAGANSNITSLTGLTTPLSVSQGGTGVSTSTGSDSNVLSTSPLLTTPNISGATITGGSISSLSSPLPVASGGTNASTASGTSLDNITGFFSTGFLTRTGAGTYAFQSLTNGITYGNLSQAGANTVLANATGSTANLAAFTMPSCSASSSALQWVSGSGFACNTGINAATLGGATFASPGPIGSTTAGTGAFTTLSTTGTTTFSGNVGIGNTSPSVAFQFTNTGGQPTVGAVGNIATTATLGKVFDGSTSSPHTTLTPSVSITRTEAINSASLSGNSPALWVETVGNNSGAGNPNSNALEAISTQNGAGDAVGLVGWGIQAGSSGHYGYGGFFNGQANTAGNNAFAVETYTANNTGTNQPLNTGSVPPMVGLHVTAGGGNNAVNTSALWVSNDTGNPSNPAVWDTGLYFSAGSVASESIIDVSSSSSSILIGGSHQYGLNLINGTYSGNAIQATGFSVSPAGVVSSTGSTSGSGAGAGIVGQLITPSASGVSIPNGSTTNVVTQALTAGDWDISGTVQITPSGATISTIYVAVVTSSGTLGGVGQYDQLTMSTTGQQTMSTPVWTVNVAAGTTAYLTTLITYSGGSVSASGAMHIRRAH